MTEVLVWCFTLLALYLVWRAIGAKRRTALPHFEDLPPALRMAALKENLLESPSKDSLDWLGSYCEELGIPFDADSYPLEVAQTIEDDDALFARQSQLLDTIEPLELGENPPDLVGALLRYYTEPKIMALFARLKAERLGELETWTALENEYLTLAQAQKESDAQYESLEKLRIQKEAWERRIRDSSHPSQKTEPNSPSSRL